MRLKIDWEGGRGGGGMKKEILGKESPAKSSFPQPNQVACAK